MLHYMQRIEDVENTGFQDDKENHSILNQAIHSAIDNTTSRYRFSLRPSVGSRNDDPVVAGMLQQKMPSIIA